MVESPAVALLFEDVALGEQLRSALLERGARIVHEGALDSLGPQQLVEVDADVLVVNLEADDDAALDRLYALIQGDRPRVVFNDAQASRKLEGWDRARWARHLAMKALATGEVDPPRPEDAREIAAPATMAVAEPAAAVVVAIEEDPTHRQIVAASETLAAELEALLAADQPTDETDDFGHGLNYAAGGEGVVEEVDFGSLSGQGADEHAHVDDGPLAPMFDAESTQPEPELARAWLPPLDDVDALTASSLPPARIELPPSDAMAASSMPPPLPAFSRASDSWSLLDDDVTPIVSAPSARQVAASEFGIQVQDPADYLAPQADTGQADSPIVPGFSLELISMEEAIAPQHYEPAHEMVLDERPTGLGRLVLLGATTEGTSSVCQFLACLPDDLAVTLLHTQHQAGKPSEALVEHLAQSCRLPVRLATRGMRARKGEVLVVPTDHQVRLRRDGVVELQPIGEQSKHAPSIDISFTVAAGDFGTGALAIVFGGRSTDAVGGCQAIHDRGGQVWVEAPSAEHGTDMVAGVLAERLSSYSGTPQALAARLIEELSMEMRS